MRRACKMIRTVTATAALFALAACGPDGARSGGPRLSVAVVPPVERDIQPGDTMEVGQLNDGFDRAVLERVATSEDETYLPPDAYAGGPDDTPRMPMPTPVGFDLAPNEAYRVAAAVGGRTAPDPLNDGSRSFGFDRPRPDFAAERAARWAQREARLARPPEEPPTQGGPVPYNDVVKYSSEEQ